MSHSIYKFAVGWPSEDIVTLTVPLASVVRHFAVQHMQPTIWMTCPVGTHTEERQFVTASTGATIPAGHKYVATTIDGSFVWHLLEVTP